METTSGGTALTLVRLVMAQLQYRGLIDLEHIEEVLQILIDRPSTKEQIADAGKALTVVQDLRNS
jgi:hypothetical protein